MCLKGRLRMSDGYIFFFYCNFHYVNLSDTVVPNEDDYYQKGCYGCELIKSDEARRKKRRRSKGSAKSSSSSSSSTSCVSVDKSNSISIVEQESKLTQSIYNGYLSVAQQSNDRIHYQDMWDRAKMQAFKQANGQTHLRKRRKVHQPHFSYAESTLR